MIMASGGHWFRARKGLRSFAYGKWRAWLWWFLFHPPKCKASLELCDVCDVWRIGNYCHFVLVRIVRYCEYIKGRSTNQIRVFVLAGSALPRVLGF